MKSALAFVVSVVSMLALITARADAHGGKYQGPGDAGAPSVGGGNGSTPPTTAGGALGPNAGQPGGSPGSGLTGGSRSGGRTNGGRLVSTGVDAGSFDTWEFWWEANKDQFLDLKGHLLQINNVTGRNRVADRVASRRPSAETIRDTIVPTLLALLDSSRDQDIDDSCILALGRVAREDSAETVIAAATPLLMHKDLSVRTAAALTLGALDSPRALPILHELVVDSSRGRQLVSGKRVELLVRSFAALSLGLINDPSSVQLLVDVVRGTTDAERDLKVCAITALGLMRDNPNVDAASQCLRAALADRKLDELVRSYVPTALGRLGDPAAVPALLAAFKDKASGNFVRQSTAIGLGLLAGMDQPDVIAALQDAVTDARDAQTRHFCFISLAQIGRRDSEHATERPSEHERLVELFVHEIEHPSSPGHRSWAALAGAIYARAGGVESAQPALAAAVGEAWQKEHDPSFKSAFALALGLLDVRPRAPELLDDFRNSREADQRGYTALALGFLHFSEVGDELRELCLSKTITPTFRLQVATALGLLGDLQAVPVLITALDSAETNSVSTAVAKALGLIGDREAVQPLNAIAQDPARLPLTRAFACVALGIVGEKGDLPWNARLRGDNNYNAIVPAMAEVLDIL